MQGTAQQSHCKGKPCIASPAGGLVVSVFSLCVDLGAHMCTFVICPAPVSYRSSPKVIKSVNSP